MTALMDLLGEPLRLSATQADGQAARREIRDRATPLIRDKDLLDDLELMVGEAIANAVLHGTAPFQITLAASDDKVRVAVLDQGPRAKELNGHRIDNGRGLDLIDAFAADWYLDVTHTATCLWFEVNR